jgi:hypothetical protein
MTSSQELVRSALEAAAGGRNARRLQNPKRQTPLREPKASALNYWNRKNVNQTPQIHNQRQTIVVPQHPAAVRHIIRRLIEQCFFRR